MKNFFITFVILNVVGWLCYWLVSLPDEWSAKIVLGAFGYQIFFLTLGLFCLWFTISER